MNRLAVKRRLGRLFALLKRPAPRRVVLLYHSVGGGPWSMSSTDFDRQMRYLARAGQFFALGDALSNAPAHGDLTALQVAVTFDDGYAALADVVRPVLKSLGMRADVFVNAGLIGDATRRASDTTLGHYPGEQFMTWGDVASLVADGWGIGSHGLTHADLTKLGQQAIDDELVQSKVLIEKRLEKCCDGFSYTWGRHSALVRNRVVAAGYRYACSAEHETVEPCSPMFEIPRMNIDRDYEFDDFLAVVQGDWDYLRWLQKARAIL